jgi:glycosyltransferase involved in cell wall biosynthesis
MSVYHLTNIKFKRLTPNYGNGKKLKLTYLTSDDKKLSVSFTDDTFIYIDNISKIIKASYGKNDMWKNVTSNLNRCLVKNPSSDKKTILLSGYSFKFIKKLFPSFQEDYNLLFDIWSGSEKHSKDLSNLQLSRTDIIFCEWCLGNALWYSKNKLPHQKLIVRLHRWEMKRDYWKKINWNNVDTLICISPYYVRLMRENLPDGVNVVYIPNYIDPSLFDVKKNGDAKYHFGMLGYTPKLKNPIKAIEFFDAFKKIQSDGYKYKLFFKGQNPFKCETINDKNNEMQYYEKFFSLIKNRNDIIVEGFSDEIGVWFSKIGYILSFSEVEGSHQAIAEGMSTGCIPYLRGGFVNSGQATDIYPEKYCKGDLVLFSERESARVREHFRNNVTYFEIRQLL